MTWVDVDGTGGDYQVNENGQIRSWINSHRFKMSTPRILRPRKSSTGYLIVGIYRKSKSVHRIVAEAFLGQPPKGHVVNHKNGHRTDNRLLNIEWVTFQRNNLHGFEIGTNKTYGSGNPATVLRDIDVLKIRKLLLSGTRIVDIAKKFKVHPSTISKIKSGETWKWLNDDK